MKVFFAVLFIVTLIPSCAHKKTKKDCEYECKERGAEYVGIVPDGIRMNGGMGPDVTHDVCQCR